MVFRLARTFGNPAAGSNPQRGFPAPGAGDQTTGYGTPRSQQFPWEPVRPTQGRRSWFRPSQGGQRGFPEPENAAQRRPAGSIPQGPAPNGLNDPVWTPYYSRGAAAYVQNYGKVLVNPIGAGIVAKYRPQASYGPAAQFINGVAFWTAQGTPTSVPTQGLNSPDELEAILGTINVQAAVRLA